MKDGEGWTPVSIIVMWLAVVVGTLILMAGINVIFTRQEMPSAKAELLSDLLKQILTIVSIYVGAKLHQNISNKKDKED